MRRKENKNDFTIVSRAIENENRRMKEEIMTLQSKIVELIEENKNYEDDSKLLKDLHKIHWWWRKSNYWLMRITTWDKVWNK